MTAVSRWLLAAFAASTSASAVAQQTTPAPMASPAAPAMATAAPTARAEPSVPPAPAVPKTVWSDVRVASPYIAMTFDDGPSKTLTPHLLDILKERNMHVTFFVVGENAKDHPEILQRAVAEGHEIGNHSWSHPNFAKMTDEAVKSELERTKEAIMAGTGGKPVTLMRPPYGSFTKDQRRWFHDELGYTTILWDVDPLDWKRPVTPAQVEERILAQTRNGSIILSHDIHATTVEAMPDTFDKLLAKGFKFVTVTELIAMNEPEPPKPPKPVSAKADSAAAKGKHTPRPAATPSPTPNANLPEKITGSSSQ